MSLNRQFCEIAVRICEEMFGIFKIFLKKIMMESKDLLQKEEFFIINLTQTRKPPLFNYPSFIKVITIRGIKRIIRNFPFDTKDFDSLHCIRMRRCILLQELLKMLMNQVTSLKTLDYYYIDYYFESIYPLGV
uniref:Uncharacterized protein n=1 Tax=Rhizophagus irregularis (strain DAOM 181602 / DAOM 197198 / MUCL 43194) TaxID=747089 RepID=U9TJ26_RHIID